MNISMLGSGAVNNANTQTIKIVGSQSTDKVRQQNKDDDKKDAQNSVAATLSISKASSQNRSMAITKRFESMKESLQKQMESLNERLRSASEQGNTELEKQLTESVKQLRDDLTSLDTQLNTALAEERQRQLDEAKKKEEEAAKKKEKEREKYKPEEEKIKKQERKSFEFFAKSDIAKESIQNSKEQKAMLSRTKGRLEGEMAIDAARSAGKEQLQIARESELNNSKGFSYVPYVSDKTILTEKKRITAGSFTPDESDNISELNKLNNGIANLENSIAGAIAEINSAIEDRNEDAADNSKSKQKNGEETKNNNDKETSVADGTKNSVNTKENPEATGGINSPKIEGADERD